MMNVEQFLKNSLVIEKEAMAAAEAMAELVQRGVAGSKEGDVLMAEFARDLTTMEKKSTMVSTMVESLSEPEMKRVFILRYFHKMSWAEICEALNLSESNVYRLHKKGIKILEAIFDV